MSERGVWEFKVTFGTAYQELFPVLLNLIDWAVNSCGNFVGDPMGSDLKLG